MPHIKTDNYSKSKKYNLRKKKDDPPSESESSSENESETIEESESYSTCSSDSNKNSDTFKQEFMKAFEKSYNKTKKNSKNRTVEDVIKYYENKYANKKSKSSQIIDEYSEEYDSSNYFSSEDDSSELSKNKRKYKQLNKLKKKNSNKKQKINKINKKQESESDSLSESDDMDSFISDNDDIDDESYNEEDSEEISESDKKNFKIMLTIGGAGGNGDEEEIIDDEDHLNSDEDEVNSDDEKTFMKENYQEFILHETENKEKEPQKNKQNKEKSNKTEKSKKNKTQKEKEELNENATDVENEYLELLDLKKHLFEKLKKKPENKMLKKAVSECNKNMNSLIKSARLKNTKLYYKLIRDDNKKTNEIEYFKKKLSNKEQLEIVRQLKEIHSQTNIDKPYRLSLLQSKIPVKYKAFALQKLNMLKEMSPGDSEYFKIKNWIDTFMKIPFGVYKNLSISIKDGLEVSHNFLEDAKNTLDICAYGHEEAKMQIMQMVGQWISNPGALGSAIAIKGPMGTGKTTLVKEGISKILGREFAFIALGGASDGSFLEGHSYTYEGSTWGRIVQILIESKCMNPVIYFDELDKISDTPKGQEIIGILTHLTDTSQNSQFHDKYFSEVDFDLSKCLFIFSYNDESLVNPILRDRMYRIQTKGYDAKEKIIIAKNYLLPKIREQVNFNEGDIIFPDDTLQYLVNQTKFTKNEEGVRNLKRCLEIIHTKLNLIRLVKPESKIFKKDGNLDIKFPVTLSRKQAETLINVQEDPINKTLLSLYT